jgi:hypothetical protein
VDISEGAAALYPRGWAGGSTRSTQKAARRWCSHSIRVIQSVSAPGQYSSPRRIPRSGTTPARRHRVKAPLVRALASETPWLSADVGALSRLETQLRDVARRCYRGRGGTALNRPPNFPLVLGSGCTAAWPALPLSEMLWTVVISELPGKPSEETSKGSGTISLRKRGSNMWYENCFLIYC